MKPLRLLLLAHLLFFGGWGTYLLSSHSDANSLFLETAPVDPRDYLSGNYVALRYPISDPTSVGCPMSENLISGTVVYVQLEQSSNSFQTKEGARPLWKGVSCQVQRPAEGTNQRWVKGVLRPQAWRTNLFIEFGIERFYVSEGNDLRYAQSGEVVAEVAIRNFEPRIMNLLKKK